MRHSAPIFVLVLASLAGTANASAPGTLQLKTGDVRIEHAEDALRWNQARAQRLPERMVLVLDGPMTTERRAQIEVAGVVVRDYMPTNAFVVETRDARLGAQRRAIIARSSL